MFAVWGWGVGINGTSSVVAVSGIFSEYMDFFYFCTCSPFKKKKEKKISNFMCCLGTPRVAYQIPPLSFWELSLYSPRRDAGEGWQFYFADVLASFICLSRKKNNKYTGSYLLRHRTSLPDRDLACTYKCHSLLPWLVGHRPCSAGAAALVPCQNGTHSPGTEPCRTPWSLETSRSRVGRE